MRNIYTKQEAYIFEYPEAVKFAEESPWPKPEEAFEDIYVQKDYPFLRE